MFDELLNDWRAWSRTERAAVTLFGAGMTLMATVLVGG